MGNLDLKVHLEPQHRLETMPNIALALPVVGNSRKHKWTDGILPEFIVVPFSLSYPLISFFIVSSFWKYHGNR